MADWSDLDPAFTLPDYVPDNWREFYEVIKARLHRETQHLPMGTVFQLKVERFCFTYVIMRYREEDHGFVISPQARELRSFWTDLGNVITRALTEFKVEDRNAYKQAIQDALVAELRKIEDNELAALLVGRFTAALEGVDA